MLTEERSLTAIERCECITLHSRIFDITTKAENGEAWLMFSRPSTCCGDGAASLVSGGHKHGRLGLFPSPFASPSLTYNSHLIQLCADWDIRAFESLTKPSRGAIAVFAWPGGHQNLYSQIDDHHFCRGNPGSVSSTSLLTTSHTY